MQHARGRSFDKGGNGSHPLAQGLLAIPQWWNKEPRAFVRLVPQKEGRWPGLKWTVYEVVVKSVASQQDGPGVHRRYSEFAWLADCLVKRVRFLVTSASPFNVELIGTSLTAVPVPLHRWPATETARRGP